MSELKELQPSFSTGYLMMLKSPIKHQAELHRNLIESSSTHISFLALSSDGLYTPEYTHSKPSTIPFNKTETENLPTKKSTFSNNLLSHANQIPPAVWIASKTAQSTNGLPHKLFTTVEFVLFNLVSCKQITSPFHSLRKIFTPLMKII